MKGWELTDEELVGYTPRQIATRAQKKLIRWQTNRMTMEAPELGCVPILTEENWEELKKWAGLWNEDLFKIIGQQMRCAMARRRRVEK